MYWGECVAALSCSEHLGLAQFDVRRVVMSCKVWRHLAKHPTRGRTGDPAEEWEEHTDERAPVSHQLSGLSCVSMSTRQMGHFLLVANH